MEEEESLEIIEVDDDFYSKGFHMMSDSDEECEKRKAPIDEIPSRQKIILGNNLISVDCFPKIHRTKYNFLTHAHTDRVRKLDHRWTHTIYCTEKTAKVLAIITERKSKKGVSSNICTILKPGISYKFNEFQVTVLDANHCHGAVMYLFEGRIFPKGAVLCTGHFRADCEFLTRFDTQPEYLKLKKTKLSNIYLDNSYMRMGGEHLERKVSAKMLLIEILKHKHRNIYIPLYLLGREQLLESLSKKLNEPITIFESKRQLMDLLGFSVSFGTSNGRRIFIVDRNSWKFQANPLKSVIIDLNVLPEGEVDSRRRAIEPYLPYIYVPFFDHSSESEVTKFLKILDFDEISPTAAPLQNKDYESLLGLSRSRMSVQKKMKMLNSVNKI